MTTPPQPPFDQGLVSPLAEYRLFGFEVSPLTWRRYRKFRANRRGFWSLWLFLLLFIVSLFADLIANDKPLLIHYADNWYVPVAK